MDQSHLQWAIKQLNESGYQLLSQIPNTVQNTPWSQVYRFNTNHGFVFLKKVPPALAVEAKIIDILCDKFHAHVPHIIAKSYEQHCFLMHDAGIQLNAFFKENFTAAILVEVMQNYITLQISATDKVPLFLDHGVPDWRLEKLPALYQELISQETLLLNDGLNQDELTALKNLTPKLISMCEQLARFKIKDTFGHADFHDKNILIDPHTHQTMLIDLGEVVITYPFFSFLNCLHRAKENFSLSDVQYRQLQQDCFAPWLALEAPENLWAILGIIQHIWSIHSVLGELRLMNSVDPLAFQELHRQGRLANNLRHWIRSE